MPKKFEIEFLEPISFEKFSVFRVMYGVRVAAYFSCDFQNAETKYIAVDECIDDDELYTLVYNYIKNVLNGVPPKVSPEK